jgi:hypothetical protein
MIYAVNRNLGDDTELPDIVLAAYAGDVEMVAKILAAGGDPNSVDPRDNLSLLHIACLQGDERLADLLLQRAKEKCDLDFSIRSRSRPRLAWQYAANANHLELAERVHEASLTPQAQRAYLLE